MNIRFSNFLICCFLFEISISCSAPLPQVPSNKVTENDSVATGLLILNAQLAEQEDSLLHIYVSKQKEKYIKQPLGFWYRIDTYTENSLLVENQNCTIEAIYMTLDDRVIEKEQLTLRLGKKQIIKGLEELLKLMHKGETATLIVPSYLAYGINGNDKNVGAYTPLKIKVHLLNEE